MGTVEFNFSQRNLEEMVKYMVESATKFLENHSEDELYYYRRLGYAFQNYNYRHIAVGVGEKLLLRQIAINYLDGSNPGLWYYNNAYGYSHMMLFFYFYGIYDRIPEENQ